jgi:hypothetical protein
LSQYKVSGEQWDKFDKQLKFNGIDPGLPPVPKTQEITKDSNKKLSFGETYDCIGQLMRPKFILMIS